MNTEELVKSAYSQTLSTEGHFHGDIEWLTEYTKSVLIIHITKSSGSCWIKTVDQLPPEDEPVFVWNGEFIGVGFYKPSKFDELAWYVNYDIRCLSHRGILHFSYIYPLDHIQRWHPMIEPPGENNERD